MQLIDAEKKNSHYYNNKVTEDSAEWLEYVFVVEWLKYVFNRIENVLYSFYTNFIY